MIRYVRFLLAIVLGITVFLAAELWLSSRTDAIAPSLAASSDTWGEPVTTITGTTYQIYKQDFVYGSTPFTITDVRPDETDKIYSDKNGYEIRALTVYRANNGQTFLKNQPVVFFVHGGSWIDGYRGWYQFVAQSFTGEKGWVTVVIDYRLTSSEVYSAAQNCSDRNTCVLPGVKAAWYPDNINDVATAFRWTVDHIADNGGNAQEIVVFGHSAGGHLVSLLATNPQFAALQPDIKGLVTMSGAYSLTDVNHLFWRDAISQTFHGGFSNTTQLVEASPARYIDSATSLPPFYILYAEDELLNLTEQNIVFNNNLTTHGFSSTISYLKGYSHTSEMKAIAYITATPTALIADWITSLFFTHKVYLPLITAH